METKFKNFTNITKDQFDSFIQDKGSITLRKARLIPTQKNGEEIQLASIFLSTMRLVKEFRDTISSEIKLIKGGQIFVYTEVCFPEIDPNCRVDGLAIKVKSGKIVDAVLFEMKSGSDKVDQTQIEKYIILAKELKIDKLVTISNEFTSSHLHSPLAIKPPKEVQLFHYSWSHIQTMGHLLLGEKTDSIIDEDQHAIMQEVLDYMAWNKSGVTDFTQMLPGWVDTINKLTSSLPISVDDKNSQEAALSWFQAEKTIALQLSRETDDFVTTGDKYHKVSFSDRMMEDTLKMIDSKSFKSTYKIKNAVTPIHVVASVSSKTMELSATISAPTNQTVKKQLSWMHQQLKNCNTKCQDIHKGKVETFFIDIIYKNYSKPERHHISAFDKIEQTTNKRDIKEFRIVSLNKDIGKLLLSRRDFISDTKDFITEFYECTVRFLKEFEEKAPAIKPILQDSCEPPELPLQTLMESQLVDAPAMKPDPYEDSETVIEVISSDEKEVA